MSKGNEQPKGQSPEVLRSGINELIGSSLSNLRLLRDITSFPDTDFRLSDIHIKELISVSLGTTGKTRSEDTGNTPNTIYNRRSRLTSAMGAETLSHAVFLGIVSEDIPIELRDPVLPPVEVEDEAVEVVFHISRGKRDKQIAREMKRSPDEVEDLFIEARDVLGGKNRPNTVRRACEERVLLVPTFGEASDHLEALIRIQQSLAGIQPALEDAVDLARK